VLERGSGSHRSSTRSVSKKAKFRGTNRSVGWICCIDLDGTERRVFFWFSFGTRLSREMLFDIIPGSTDLIPDKPSQVPVSTATGILWQELDLPYVLAARTTVYRRKSRKFPVPRE